MGTESVLGDPSTQNTEPDWDEGAEHDEVRGSRGWVAPPSPMTLSSEWDSGKGKTRAKGFLGLYYSPHWGLGTQPFAQGARS